MRVQRLWRALCCCASCPSVPSVAALQVLQEAGSHLADLAARTASNVLQLRHVLLRLQPRAKVVEQRDNSYFTTPGESTSNALSFAVLIVRSHLEGELVHKLACRDIKVRAIGATTGAAAAAAMGTAAIFPPKVIRRRDSLRALEPRQTRLLLVLWHPLVLHCRGNAAFISIVMGVRPASGRQDIDHGSHSIHEAGRMVWRPTDCTNLVVELRGGDGLGCAKALLCLVVAHRR